MRSHPIFVTFPADLTHKCVIRYLAGICYYFVSFDEDAANPLSIPALSSSPAIASHIAARIMAAAQSSKRPAAVPPLVLALLLAACANVAQGCIYKYGSSPLPPTAGDGNYEGYISKYNGTFWNYANAGVDWTAGDDGKGQPWMCASGKRQSPLNVPSLLKLGVVPDQARTTFDFGTIVSDGKNIQVRHRGRCSCSLFAHQLRRLCANCCSIRRLCITCMRFENKLLLC